MRTGRGAGPRDDGPRAGAAGGGSRGFVALLAVAFLLSGGAGLIHEVVWVRLLGHVFGVTAFAVSTVLAAYMGGLALGAYVFGRRSARIADPSRLYAWIEIGIGVFALAVPFVLEGIEPLYGWIWRRLHVSFVTFSALRFLVAGSLLIVPTLMMGATLPLLAEHFARLFGRRAAPEWLYTVNLFGAVLGVSAGGFLLMPLLGLWGTILAGAGLNIGVGLLVLACYPRVRLEPVFASPGTVSPSMARDAGQPRERRLEPDAILLAAAFVSGLTCLASQVAWTRLISLLIGSTTYAFSTVLLAFLLALAAGSAWASRGARDLKDARPPLAILNALSALALLAAIAAVNRWPSWYWWAFSAWRPESLAAAVAINAAAVLAILIAPLLVAGTVFPLTLMGARSGDPGRTGRAVGSLYAVNTIGAILGATIGGFVLVPRIGSRGTLMAVAAVTSLFALACALPVRSRKLTGVAVAGLAVVAAGIVLGPTWDQKTLNAAIYEPKSGVDPRGRNPEDRVVFHREGPTATVMVLDRPPASRYMRINGRINASNTPRDLATNVLLAQIPILLARRSEEVLVVGLASGVTAGAALQSPARRVTVIELEPAVVEASRLFDQVSHAPLDDPRLRLIEDDARHILVASDSRFDVIISEPSHPWVSGVANLFTRDFFTIAALRLRDDGVFAQWLQTYQISPNTFRSILATFQSVFPEVFVFRSIGSDLILIGSRRPLTLDLSDLERRWLDPVVGREMARIGFGRPESLLAHFLTGPSEVRGILVGAPINTDDNMLVEFRAPAEVLLVRDEQSDSIWAGMPTTPVESLLRDPDRLLRRRDSLAALIEALDARRWPSERYRRILAGL